MLICTMFTVCKRDRETVWSLNCAGRRGGDCIKRPSGGGWHELGPCLGPQYEPKVHSHTFVNTLVTKTSLYGFDGVPWGLDFQQCWNLGSLCDLWCFASCMVYLYRATPGASCLVEDAFC